MKLVVCNFIQNAKSTLLHFSFIDANLPSTLSSIDIPIIQKTKKISKIELIREYNIKFDENDFYQDEDYKVEQVTKLNALITELGFKDARINIAINSIHFFKEEFTIPKLSGTTLQKTISMELNKIYPDYENKYIASSSVVIVNKKNMKISTILCQSSKYYQILTFFKNTDLKIGEVFMESVVASQYLIDRKYASKNAPFMFIDILKETSLIVVAEGQNIYAEKFSYCGFLPYFEKVKAIQDDEKAENVVVDITQTSLKNFQKSFKTLIDDIMKVCAKIVSETYKLEIDKILINVESTKIANIDELFTQALGIECVKVPFTESFEQEKYLLYANTYLSSSQLLQHLPIRVK